MVCPVGHDFALTTSNTEVPVRSADQSLPYDGKLSVFVFLFRRSLRSRNHFSARLSFMIKYKDNNYWQMTEEKTNDPDTKKSRLYYTRRGSAWYIVRE